MAKGRKGKPKHSTKAPSGPKKSLVVDKGSPVQVSESDSGCPHVSQCASVDKLKKSLHPKKELKKCEGCRDVLELTEYSVWICLRCFHRGCDRNSEYRHALKHFEKLPSHSVAVHLQTFQIWCYACDDSVDPGQSNNIRQSVAELKMRCDERRRDHSPVNEQGSCSTPGVKGLANLGNTCFFNSVIQTLNQTSLLHNVLARSRRSGMKQTLVVSSGPQEPLEVTISDPPGKVTASLLTLFEDMKTSNSKHVTPRAVFNNICSRVRRFGGYQQQDSHELLRYLLDEMKMEEQNRMKRAILAKFGVSNYSKDSMKELSDVDRKDIKAYGRNLGSTFVEDVFGGKLMSFVLCCQCKHVSKREEDFLDLSLSVPSLDKHQRGQPAGGDRESNAPKVTEQLSKHQLKKKKKEEKKKQKQNAKVNLKGSFHKLTEIVSTLSSKESGGRASNPDMTAGTSLSTNDNHVASEKDVVLANNTAPQRGISEVRESKLADQMLSTASDDLMVTDVVDVRGESTPSNHTHPPVAATGNDTPPPMGVAGSNTHPPGVVAGSNTHPPVVVAGSNTHPPVVVAGSNTHPSGVVTGSNTHPSGVVTGSNTHPPVVVAGSNTHPPVVVAGSDTPPLEDVSPDPRSEVVGSEQEDKSPSTKVGSGSLPCPLSSASLPVSVDALESCLLDFTGCELLSGKDQYACDVCTELRGRQQTHTVQGDITMDTSQCSKQDNSHPDSDSDTLEATGNGDQKCSANEENSNSGGSSNGGETVFTDAQKKLLISSPPAVLTLHLKRFEQKKGSGARLVKNNRHIRFPPVLDISPFCTEDCEVLTDSQGHLLYSLYGVVEHHGSMSGGHYVAYVRLRPPTVAPPTATTPTPVDGLDKMMNECTLEGKDTSLNDDQDHPSLHEPSLEVECTDRKSMVVVQSMTDNDGPDQPHPPSSNDRDQPRPPSSDDQVQPHPPSSGDQDQPCPPSSDDQVQPHPPSSGDQDQSHPPLCNQGQPHPLSSDQDQPRPPSSGDQNQPHPPSSGDQDEPHPSLSDDQNEPHPSSSSDQNQRHPSSSCDQDQPHPSSSSDRNEPHPLLSSDQDQPHPPSSNDLKQFDVSSLRGQWVYISDSHVSRTTEDKVLNSQAFLLFYEKLPLVS